MTQDSSANTRYDPNTWLISNTSLYFSTRMLQGYDKVGYQGILELSKLSEAILMADNIVTLEGGDRDSRFVPVLREKRLLKEIPHRSRGGKFVKKSTIENEYLAKFLTSQQHRKKVSEIITTIFPISYRAALEAIKASAKRTITHDEFLNLQIDKNHRIIKNAITENYLRTILYLDIAASYGLNYSPDTFRIPIVEYINSSIKETLNRYIRRKRNPIERLLKTIHETTKENWTVDIGNTYQMEVPASFGLILNECTSRKDFINRALEIREEYHFKKFRSKLVELDKATRSGDRTKANNIVKESQEIFQGIKKEEPFPYDSLIVLVPPFITLLGGAQPDLAYQISTAGSIYGAARGLVYYIKRRRLQYLHNIKKRFDQTIKINKQIKDKFGSNLTLEEVNNIRQRMMV